MTSILTKFRLLRPSYAVIDSRGTILRVNDEWRAFARASDMRMPDDGVGSCYFDHCAPDLVGELSERLRELALGRTASVMYLYPCATPERKRWFVLMGMQGENGRPRPDRATLVHLDVTELLLGQKSDTARQLAADLQSTLPLSSEALFVDTMQDALREYFNEGEGNRVAEIPAIRRLIPQEERVASLLAEGMSNEEIANRLQCSVNTTKRHVSAILRKLGLESRAKVAAWYHQRQAS